MGREIDYGGAAMRHGSPRRDRVRGRFRNQPSKGKHDTAKTSIQPGSGVMAGRCILYPPHSTLFLLPDGTVFAELVNSRKSPIRKLGRTCAKNDSMTCEYAVTREER
jgi:hypothetical protein